MRRSPLRTLKATDRWLCVRSLSADNRAHYVCICWRIVLTGLAGVSSGRWVQVLRHKTQLHCSRSSCVLTRSVPFGFFPVSTNTLMQSTEFLPGTSSLWRLKAHCFFLNHKRGNDAERRQFRRSPRCLEVRAKATNSNWNERVESHPKAVQRVGAAGKVVEKDQHLLTNTANETAWRRWTTGPVRYYTSWLFPLSALVGVCSQQFVEFLARHTAPVDFVWNRLAVAGLSKSMVVTVLAYSGALFAFGFLPMSDTILGRDTSTPLEGAAGSMAYRIPLYLFVPMYLALLAVAFRKALVLSSFPARFLGVVLSLGSCGGLAFTAAHELLHGRRKFDRFLSGVLLCPLFYMHWANSHLCHHCKVGTPEDPATARFGESLFRFVPRSVIGNLRDGIDMEKKRLESRGKSFVCLENRFFLWIIAPTILSLGVHRQCGPHALLMLFGSALTSILLLESVNYIEHYGLERKRLANGKYEPVGPQHSWNADWIVTSAAIFQLQRHSHHHAQASLPYQALCSISKAPLLPASYPVMMLAAFCPPLFYKCMNERAQQIKKHA